MATPGAVSYRVDADNPWPGLAWFDEAGAQFFNGRRREVAELKRLVTEAPLTVLFGRSGLGKTSLLRAGLFPVLESAGLLPVYLRFDFAADENDQSPLMEQLAAELVKACNRASAEPPLRAEGEPFWEYLHRASFKVWSAHNQPLVPLFVVDQFEEVFTLGAARPAAVARLREDLADLVENRIPVQTERTLATNSQAADRLALRSQPYRVLLSFREDFATSFERWRELPSLMRNRLQLAPMTGLQAFDAVYESGSAFLNRDTAEAIVRFVASVKQSGTATGDEEAAALDGIAVEPALLSLVCRGLNTRRQARQATGGPNCIDRDLLASTGGRVVDDHYDACMQAQPERVHRFVETELVTELGFRKPCAQDDAMREPYGVSLDALRVLVDMRLLRIEPSLGVTRVELIHDLLAPTVVARRDARRQADATARAADEWRRAEEQRQAEAAERATHDRSRRQLRVAIAIALGALLVTAGVGGLALYARGQQRHAQQQTEFAEIERARALMQATLAKSRELAAAAVTRVDLDPELATRLALEAVSVSATIQAESALRQSLIKWDEKDNPRAAELAFGPPTRRTGVTSSAGDAKELPSPITRFMGHQATATSAAISPDGTRLLTTSCDRTARVWDLATGKQIHVLRDHKHSVMVGAFSKDGRKIATGGGNFCPGGLFTGRSEYGAGDTVVRIWDAASGQLISKLEGQQTMVMGVAFSPDGGAVAAGGYDKGIRVWDLTSGQSRQAPASDSVQWIEYSPDGRQLAAAHANGEVTILDTTAWNVRQRLHHEGPVLGLSYSGDGRSLGTADSRGVTKIWRTDAFELIREIKSYGGGNATAFSSDGRFLVTAAGELSLWETQTGTRLKSIEANTTLFGASISPDGKWVALAGGSGTLGLVGVFRCEACVPLNDLLALANARNPRVLTDQEHKDFLTSDQPP